MIKTKSVYSPRGKDDGLRVLITRYWPRGVRKEAQDAWLRGLGPDAGLIRQWKAGQITWEKFEKSYLEEYKSEEKTRLMDELKEMIKGQNGKPVTLLCACGEGEPCHRRIVKALLSGR
ncbi:MAG: DUF488 family protein [Deltaproteobacteria bacterium]|nr:DUF488 family protein [Deltaproteobacteria bacterium]